MASVNDDLSEHLRMVTVSSSTWISGSEDTVAESVHSGVYNTNEVILRNVFLQVHWQGKLVHGILNVQRNRSFRRWVGGTSILPKNGFFLRFRS